MVLAPKPLLQQWQDELMELLDLPSARWTGKAWVDENDLEYPSDGAKSLGKCPRRIGLVSQGLVVRGLPEAVNQLLKVLQSLNNRQNRPLLKCRRACISAVLIHRGHCRGWPWRHSHGAGGVNAGLCFSQAVMI